MKSETYVYFNWFLQLQPHGHQPHSLNCLSVTISAIFGISYFKMHDVLFLKILAFVEHLYCQALCKVFSWIVSFNFYSGLCHTLDIIIILIVQLRDQGVNVSRWPRSIRLTLRQDKAGTCKNSEPTCLPAALYCLPDLYYGIFFIFKNHNMILLLPQLI